MCWESVDNDHSDPQSNPPDVPPIPHSLGQPPTEDHPLADSLVYSLAVQELLITITTQSAANEPGLGWAGLGWAGLGCAGGCRRGAEKGRTGLEPTRENSTIPVGLYRKKCGPSTRLPALFDT